ncbi:OadG family protein [Alteromonas ponticola]|uniref:Probable oxaloacetate decarboxylase gamma chain n=1 Tax=Alteromonas aquimaris TaxID=2998417 RepID=A0ABT3P4G3_9ALTE|nr:OadG family protein [Alteromonas aquimaris]MCW8107660.1 OadG family protein [Alteromonas aquimaris]
MKSETVSTLLVEAASLLAIGMVFVFLFLALLIAAINLIAAFCRKFPGNFPAESSSVPLTKPLATPSRKIDDTTLAVIGAAVHQYRKQHQSNVKD